MENSQNKLFSWLPNTSRQNTRLSMRISQSNNAVKRSKRKKIKGNMYYLRKDHQEMTIGVFRGN